MRRNLPFILVSLLTCALLGALLINHARYVPLLTNFALLNGLLFVHLCLKVTASIAAKPHVADPDVDLGALSVDVVVPIYNEDPALLAAGVEAIAAQTRPPRALWLIDDGSVAGGEPALVLTDPVVERAVAAARARGITVHTVRQPNAGKRWAQSRAFSSSDADIFITIDSDTCLDPVAIEKLLVPFSLPTVQSVAGLACGQNYRRSVLTRAIDLGFAMGFVQGRMAEGFFGSVRVNCGILAAYRGEVVRENLPRYLEQSFLGARVKAGDDRALTFFAKERGRTEFQIEAIAYSALPERISHLARQRMRWARSWIWGTLWLLRRPVTGPDFWFTFTQLLGILSFGSVLGAIVLGTAIGAVSPAMLGQTVLAVMLIGAVSHLRYVAAIHRRDPLWQRLLTWLCSPLASLLYVGLFLPLYFVAIVRPRPQQVWGTRSRVEVGLHAPALAAGSSR